MERENILVEIETDHQVFTRFSTMLHHSVVLSETEKSLLLEFSSYQKKFPLPVKVTYRYPDGATKTWSYTSEGEKEKSIA